MARRRPPHHPPRKVPPALITFTWLLLIALAGGIVALIDGILRMRRSVIVGIIEIVVSALFLLSLFIPGIPFGSLVLGVATLIVLIIGLITRGKLGYSLTIIAIILMAIWIVLVNHWVTIPGIN
jgi:hypothetical protein